MGGGFQGIQSRFKKCNFSTQELYRSLSNDERLKTIKPLLNSRRAIVAKTLNVGSQTFLRIVMAYLQLILMVINSFEKRGTKHFFKALDVCRRGVAGIRAIIAHGYTYDEALRSAKTMRIVEDEG